MSLTTKHLYHMGPLLRVQWQRGDEPENERVRRGSLWIEKPLLERLRAGLVPAVPPSTHQQLMGDCWLWTGPADSDGRATVYNNERSWAVHRLLYVIEHGPLEDRVHLIPACGVGRCCNPHHQMQVDRGPVPRPPSSVARGKYPVCRNGHVLTPQNVYLFQGKPMCRDCRAAAQARYRERQGRQRLSSGSPSPDDEASTWWPPGEAPPMDS